MYCVASRGLKVAYIVVTLSAALASSGEPVPSVRKPENVAYVRMLMALVDQDAFQAELRAANQPVPELPPIPGSEGVREDQIPDMLLERAISKYSDAARSEYIRDAEAFCIERKNATRVGIPKRDRHLFELITQQLSWGLPQSESLLFLTKVFNLPEDFERSSVTVFVLRAMSSEYRPVNGVAIQEYLANVLYQLYQRTASDEGMKVFAQDQRMFMGYILEALSFMGKPGFDRREQLGLGRDQAICDWGLPGSGKTLKEVVQAYKKAPDVYTKMAVMDALQSGRFSPVSEEVKGIIRECVLELLAHEKNDLREYGVMYAKSFGDPTFLPKLRALAANDPHHRVVTFDTSTPDPKTGKFEFTRDVRDRYMVREKAQEAIENIEKRLAQERR